MDAPPILIDSDGEFARPRPSPQASAGKTNQVNNNRRHHHHHYDEGPDLATGALLLSTPVPSGVGSCSAGRCGLRAVTRW